MYRDVDCCWPSTQDLALRRNEVEAALGYLGSNPQLVVEDKGWSLKKGSNLEFSNRKDATRAMVRSEGNTEFSDLL